MRNRGQTTVFFSCMISVLLIFTLTALEVGRIHCGKMKIRAVVHSAQSSIMADYNRELFERYHLLFIDPTYGTGSDAIVEERFQNYLETSLNGTESVPGISDSKLYDFSVEEIAVIDKKTITDDHMKLLKKQITEYEKEEGLLRKAAELGRRFVDSSKDIQEAGERTERNAIVIPDSDEGSNTADTSGNSTGSTSGGGEAAVDGSGKVEVEDPRDVLKKQLDMGILALVLPEGSEVSDERLDFSKAVSTGYKDIVKKEKDASFSDVDRLVDMLADSSKDDTKALLGMGDKLAFCTYVSDHFSCHGKSGDGVMKCEIEYILKGRDNDHDNLEAVVSDIIWIRMPVNYVCLLKDSVRQSEALTLATAICTATATMPMVEVVKYLLLGCWSYGESIYEVRMLMHGEKLPYIKTSIDWNTDLKTLAKACETTKTEIGMDYQDYLYLFLAQKEGRDVTYARMLDIIEKNLQRENENISAADLCGELTLQGRVSFNPLLTNGGMEETYKYFFEEVMVY